MFRRIQIRTVKRRVSGGMSLWSKCHFKDRPTLVLNTQTEGVMERLEIILGR